MTIGIYSITHITSNKTYVGLSSCIEKRWKKHIKLSKDGDKRHLYCAIRKYGIESFKFEILEQCSINELNDKEQYWINKLQSYQNGFNLTLGGNGVRGHKFSDETKKKISQSVSKTMTQEHRKLLSNLNLGRKLSDETKLKMSISRKGRKMSDEAKLKISLAKKGKPLSDSHKLNLSKAKRKIKCKNFSWQ